ncbi:MAG: SusD/RagB family nutrient-binding outer membrane lipoprotein [Prevotellaceae bacterium]|jgi:hypothetical protein|nr:SusD/RagB family nutrient-binding outer membrane lipoprotein [Prevotellaceae bacterium]
MKNNFLIIAILFTISLASCKDWLDINHDPDALEQVPDANALLPAAEMGIANNLMGWDFGFGGGFWVEYWTQSYSASQFKTLCEYLPQDFNITYLSLTSEGLTDLRRIIKMTANDENKGYYFVAEALSIFAWQIITDVWGDMPYSEALRGDEGIYNPVQEKGKDIYADLLKRIDDLLTVDLDNSTISETQDLIYHGDLDKWYQFASALKLKLMLRLSETPDYNNATVLTYIQSADLLTSSAKISGSLWDDAMEGKRHPMREFQAGGANYFSQNVIACKSFFDYLRVNSDPRQSKLFSGSKAAFFGDFDSKEDADGNGTADDKESYATAIIPANLDLILMSDWEVAFYVAEVYARAGNHTQAKAYYDAGVKASLNQHGIDDYSIIEPGGYAQWTDGTIENEIKAIVMQKWVANCNYQHLESFLERNRTKYPSVNEINIAADRRTAWTSFPVGSLTVSVKGRQLLQGNLPASPLYPEYYIFRNSNAPSQKPDVGQKVWWNLKTGK